MGAELLIRSKSASSNSISFWSSSDIFARGFDFEEDGACSEGRSGPDMVSPQRLKLVFCLDQSERRAKCGQTVYDRECSVRIDMNL